MQVLVFRRQTLEFVSNDTVSGAADLAALLDGAPPRRPRLDDGYLVIVSQHATSDSAAESELPSVLSSRLGFPKSGPMNRGQWWSGIAVPGMKPGQADVNIDFDPSGKGSGGDKGLKGYLGRDQYLQFTFVPSSQVPFSYTAPEFQAASPHVVSAPATRSRSRTHGRWPSPATSYTPTAGKSAGGSRRLTRRRCSTI